MRGMVRLDTVVVVVWETKADTHIFDAVLLDMKETTSRQRRDEDAKNFNLILFIAGLVLFW